MNKRVYLSSSEILGEKESVQLRNAFSQSKKVTIENEEDNTEKLKKEL